MRNHWILFTLFLETPLFTCSQTEAAPTRRLGLMIGANDGGKGRVVLQYANSDAENFARSMEELGGLQSADRILLNDPDSMGLAMGLELLASRAREAKSDGGRIEAVVYYSGHADEDGLLLKGKRFPFRDFRTRVDEVPADVRIAIVDACASGALTRLKGGRALPAFLADASSHATGSAFLTSSSGSEAAQESDRIGASFFSHYLNTGLRGAADASLDGRVTIHEAYQYAYHETLARTEKTASGPQHPAYDMRIAGAGDVVLTELSRAEATLAMPEQMHGRFFIRDAQDRLVAEVQKPAGRPLRIALAPGVYQTRWHHGQGISEKNFTLAKGDVKTLEAGKEWKQVSRESTVARGGGDPLQTVDSEWAEAREREFQFNLMNRAEEDFGGTQLSLLYNRAHKRLDGQQLSVIANQADSSMSGVQAATMFNYAEGPVRGGQFTSFLNVVNQDLEGIQLGNVNLGRGQVDGGQIGGSFNVALGRMRGIQASGGFNFAKEEMHGVQGAGGFNIAKSIHRGGQGSGGFNVVRQDLEGGQGAGGFNVTGGSLRGGQGSGGFNVVGGNLEGGQGAAGFNVVGGDLNGGQGSAGFNVTGGSVNGSQGAAGFNIAGGDLTGLQVAAGFNLAGGTVDGFQFGIINFARDYECGAPIGLLNFVAKGVWRGDAWVDETGFAHVGLVTGTRYVNSRLAVGRKSFGDNNLMATTLGLEGHIPLEPAFVELGLLHSSIVGEGAWYEHGEFPDLLSRVRLTLGVDLGPYVSLAGGVSWAVLINPADRAPLVEGIWGQQDSYEDRLHQWPGAHLSLRVGNVWPKAKS